MSIWVQIREATCPVPTIANKEVLNVPAKVQARDVINLFRSKKKRRFKRNMDSTIRQYPKDFTEQELGNHASNYNCNNASFSCGSIQIGA
jgi:hypothetical protein